MQLQKDSTHSAGAEVSSSHTAGSKPDTSSEHVGDVGSSGLVLKYAAPQKQVLK